MITIDNILVDDSAVHTKFACDLAACKGACCTFPGGRGAPLHDHELAEIEKAFPSVKPFLPKEHLDIIEQYGLFDGFAGNYATQCVEHKACVFVYFDSGIAKCGLERAYIEGKTSFRKPISCHLFPIRIGHGGREIHFEHFSECGPALAKGEQKNIPVYEFAQDSLVRAFGQEWTDKLKETVMKKPML